MSLSWGDGPDNSHSSMHDARASSCTLTPAASAFSAIISAFVGSFINGLTSGWLVAFATGWIAWLAVFRVLLSALYMIYRSVTDSWGPGKKTNDDAASASQTEASSYLIAEYNGYSNSWEAPPAYPPGSAPHPQRRRLLPSLWPSAAVVRGLDRPPIPRRAPGAIVRTWTDLSRDVTFLGWFSWFYTALFAPVTQILFVAANASRHDVGGAKIVKGLTVAVTALPLCIDCRVRYADSLKWGRRVFNLVTAFSCLLQGGICAFLLISGLVDLRSGSRSGPPFFVGIIYPVFALFWMVVSFTLLPMRDGGRKRAGDAHWAGYILDVGMGIFAGVFLAAPAIILYSSARASRSPGQNNSDGLAELQAYLRCETLWFKKFAAVAP